MRLLLASAIIGLTAAAVAAVGLASPASADETRTYTLSGFKKIEASTAFTIEFTQSPTWSVIVESKYDTLQHVIVEKVGDTLRIYRPKDNGIDCRVEKSGDKSRTQGSRKECRIEDIVRISAPDIDALTLNTAIKFTAGTLNLDKLDIDANAAVTINIANLKTGALNIDAEAATTLTLAGTCTRLDLALGAASTMKAEGLKCREMNVDAGPASTVHAYASERAIAHAGVASTITVSGNPRDFQKSATGFGAKISLAN